MLGGGYALFPEKSSNLVIASVSDRSGTLHPARARWGLDTRHAVPDTSGMKHLNHLTGNASGLTGNVSGLTGDASGLFGDVSGLFGDVS